MAYTILPAYDEDSDEVCEWLVTDGDGFIWDGFETREDAEEFVAERETDERDDRARDIFAADLDALADEMRGWSREQIRVVKDAMIEGLQKARAMGQP